MVLLKENLFQKLQHCLFMNQIFYINFCLKKIILDRLNRHVRLIIVLILIFLWLPTGPCHKRRNFSDILLLFLLFLLNYFFLCIKGIRTDWCESFGPCDFLFIDTEFFIRLLLLLQHLLGIAFQRRIRSCSLFPPGYSRFEIA